MSDGSASSTIARAGLPASMPTAAIAYAVGATILFSVMIILVRMVTAEIDALQAAFFRNLFGLVAMLPWFVARGGWRRLRTRHPGLHGLRALSGALAMLTWFVVLTRLQIGEAVALGFTAPLFATLGAVVFLGERLRIRRIAATVAGFAGVLVIVRPGLQEVSPWMLLALFSAFFAGCSVLFVKRLSATEDPFTIVAIFVLILTPLSAIPAAFVWTWPPLWLWPLLLAMGVCATIGQFFFAQALKRAEATAVMPFDYFRLPLAAALGFLFFGEVLDLWTWFGAAIIILATAYIGQREAALARQGSARTKAPGAALAPREKL